MTWNSSDTEVSEYDAGNLLRLLAKIGRVLVQESLAEDTYAKGYECTIHELACRHEFLQDILPDVAPLPSRPESRAASLENASQWQPKSTVSIDDGTGPYKGETFTKERGTPKVVETMLKDLYEVSSSLMHQFVPRDMTLRRALDPVLRKYWGALDRIFRVCMSRYVIGDRG